MNDALNDASTPSTSSATPASDPDLIEQARPGHGVPSQDPDPGAQYPIDPEHAREEEKTVYMGGGVLAGVATGAAIGTAVGQHHVADSFLAFVQLQIPPRRRHPPAARSAARWPLSLAPIFTPDLRAASARVYWSSG